VFPKESNVAVLIGYSMKNELAAKNCNGAATPTAEGGTLKVRSAAVSEWMILGWSRNSVEKTVLS